MTATGADTPSSAPLESTSASPAGWRLVYLLWFIRLFRPEWVIAYYVPALGFIRTAPTLILAILVAIWLPYPRKRLAELKWIILYFLIIAGSAPFAMNVGRSKPVVRFLFELLLIGAATYSFVDTQSRVKSLIRLFVVYYIYIALWGIAFGGLVPWDNVLNQEDSFGPLMAIAVGFCSQCLEAARGRRDKLTSLAGYVITVAGVISSFARGAFLSLVAILLYRVAVSKRVVRNLVFTMFAGIVVVAASFVLVPADPNALDSAKQESAITNPFWKEMASVSDGTSKGTGEDRKVLWSIAWEIYKAHPVFGAGPQNFGVVAPDFVDRVEGNTRYRASSIWGRALHNGYFQVLSEGGTVGALSFGAIVVWFFMTNRRTRMQCRRYAGGPLDNDWFENVATGLKLSGVAYMMNLFFYDITYYDWFWNLLLLNSLLAMRVGDWSMIAGAAVDSRPDRADELYWHPALGPRPGVAALNSGGAAHS